MATFKLVEHIKNQVTNDLQSFMSDLIKNRTTSPRELTAFIQSSLIDMQTRVSSFGLDSIDMHMGCVTDLQRSIVALQQLESQARTDMKKIC